MIDSHRRTFHAVALAIALAAPARSGGVAFQLDTAEVDAYHVRLALAVNDARDAIATCNAKAFSGAMSAIQAIHDNAVLARRHLVEQEVDLRLDRRALLESVADSPTRQALIRLRDDQIRELDAAIKRWQTLVETARQHLDTLPPRFKENCSKRKAGGVQKGTPAVTSPATTTTQPPPTTPPVEPLEYAQVVCPPCQAIANELAEAEHDLHDALFELRNAESVLRALQEQKVHTEHRLKELQEQFNHQIGKGASSGVDPDTGRPIESRFIATGQVQVTRTNADGTTSTTLRESEYMNALKQQIGEAENWLKRFPEALDSATLNKNMWVVAVDEETRRCERLEKALEDCIKKYCNPANPQQMAIGSTGGSGDETVWRGSAPGTVVGGTTTRSTGLPYEYGPPLTTAIYDPVRRIINLVRAGVDTPAANDPTYQLMIIVVRRTRVPAASRRRGPEYEGPRFAASVRPWRREWSTQQTSGDRSAIPGVKTFLTSLGNSTGDTFELLVQNGDAADLDVVGEGVVVEPVAERAAAQMRREMPSVSAAGTISTTVQGYCLEFLRQPPQKNMMYRIAGGELQQRFESARRIVAAAQQLQDKAALTPDSDPTGYFHAIRQWAVWTHEQRFDAEAFGRAFIDHTRKNLQNSGRPWSKAIEDAVRKFVPGRWRDIQQVLDTATVTSR